MRIIECSPYPAVPGQIGFIERASNSLKYGMGWFGQVEAEAKVIGILSRNLDNKYTLIHSLALPGLEPRVPLVLVGPPGVFAVTVTRIAGIFRARGESWASVDSQRRYRAVRPNLILDTANQAKAVQKYLIARDVPELTVEPVLVCTDPGTHVESVRPVTRVVLSDAVERFAAGLPQAEQVLITVELDEIVETLEHPIAVRKGAAEADAQLIEQLGPEPVKKTTFIDQLNLTRQQAITLAILGGITALFLIGVIIFILVTL
ncbi:MAG TPA: NERD domain-containing protein [Anaerolineaceae bacterium]|nr:NERD domain-containing protein [Anaerolineaceae bacterium]